MTRLFAIGLTAMFLADAAHAQAPRTLNESAKAVVGTWEFSNADRDKTCSLILKSDPTPNGFKLEFDKNCGALFPLANEVVAWNFPENDLLYLLDAHGKALVEFSEVEDGIYEAPTPGVGVLFLQSPAGAAPAPKAVDQVAGDWAIVRGNNPKPLCQLTLVAEAAQDGMVLKVKPGCDPTITRLNFIQWKIDGDEVMLLPARGAPWRFEEVDSNSWRRVPDSATPITLVRQ